MKVGHEKHRILYIHTRKFEGEVKGMGIVEEGERVRLRADRDKG